MKRKNKQNNPITFVILSISILIAVSVIFVPSVFMTDDFFADDAGGTEYYMNPLHVSFIDVGQGDCSLFSCNGVNILVDGGEAEYADTVLSYLDSVNVDKIDCYVLSHPHSDHIGASAEIIESLDIDTVFMTSFSEFNIPTTRVYEKTLDAISESEAGVVFVQAGETYTFGDVELNILAPIEETSDYNDMSVVFTASYKDTTVLYTGDASASVEKQILELNSDISADVLKVGHHGSTTSSSDEFIDAVSPYFAVISCGEGNSYGHPHDEIIDMLEAKNIKYQRTDEGGTVIYYGDGKSMYTGVLG